MEAYDTCNLLAVEALHLENGPDAQRFTADMPDLDLESELRAAVFARVQRLREQYGERIPSAELSAGVTFRGRRVPIWNFQKGIFKPAALGRDGAALCIRTSADSPYEDDHDPEAGRFIDKCRGNDLDHSDRSGAMNENASGRQP